MESKLSFKERVKKEFDNLTIKEKIVWILQFVLSFVILGIAGLGVKGVFSLYYSNIVAWALLICLFIVSGIKFVPNRLIYASIYFVLALMTGAILAASFFI